MAGVSVTADRAAPPTQDAPRVRLIFGALMLVLLAAIDEGLAAGVYGVPVEEEPRWRELLVIPDDLRIVAGATVGRPLPDPSWSKVTSRATQRRRTLDELVGWNRWSA